MKQRAIIHKAMEKVHVKIPELFEQMRGGRISRREFLHTATLLGMSVSAATVASACNSSVRVGRSNFKSKPTGLGHPRTFQPEARSPIKRGGILRVGTSVKAVDHPARYAWTFDANQTRMVFEYLTETGADNITRPYLLESWKTNEELTEWELKLRQGIFWTNGDEFVADHVKFNFEEWLNPDVGSSILSQWSGFLTSTGIEVVDDYTVRLYLDAPLLAVPEQLFHYPAQILHPSFDGDVTTGNTPSTGPMTIKEYVIGERVVLEAREGYWQDGADGNPLPYLDGMEFLDLGEEQVVHIAALLSGQIDRIYDVQPDTYLAMSNNQDVNITEIGTATTRVLRFRTDLKPWDDNVVRTAVKLCQNRDAILNSAYFGQGILGYDTHISPVHPAWAPMDLPEFNPEKANELLQEAGYRDGLEFTISVGTGWTDILAYIEILQEDARAAGIDIYINPMPNASYWDIWTETPVGVTSWAHRPLAVMLLPLAYTSDPNGNPVPWNETRWIDEEFSQLLAKAQGTANIEERRERYAMLQRIQQERGSIAVAYFINRWAVSNPGFHGIEAHPADYNLHREVWYDPEMDVLRK